MFIDSNEKYKSPEMEQIYKNLIEQFYSLDEREQHAIFVYKSRFFLFVSKILNIENYKSLSGIELETIIKNDIDYDVMHGIFKGFHGTIGGSKLKENPIFKFIDTESFANMLESIKTVVPYIESASSKMILQEDITVYRATNGSEIPSGKLSNSGVVSTSTCKETARGFMADYDPFRPMHYGSVGTLYELEIKKGTHVMVSPKGVERRNGGILTLIDSDQNEILFLSREVEHELEPTRVLNIQGTNKTIDVIKGIVKPKGFLISEQSSNGIAR